MFCKSKGVKKMGFRRGASRWALVIVPIIIGVAGCGQHVWVKPGGTQGELSSVRYICLQEAQQREAKSKSAGNSYGAYRSASVDTTVTNDTLFNACMNSQGWYSKYVPEPSAQAQADALQPQAIATPQAAAGSAPSAATEKVPSTAKVKTKTKSGTKKKSEDKSQLPSANQNSLSPTIIE